MVTNFRFDRSYWYSGFDGNFLAELMPSQPNYWFITVMGGKYLASSEAAYPETKILAVLQQYQFKFEQATWEQQKTEPFTQNPFLAKLPAYKAIAICQSGSFNLPQTPRSNQVKVFTPEPVSNKFKTGYIYFIATEDYQYLKIGFSQNPASRFTEIQMAHPQTLIMLGSVSSSLERSQAIQKQFSHLLVRSGWFSYTSELQAHIELLLAKKV